MTKFQSLLFKMSNAMLNKIIHNFILYKFNNNLFIIIINTLCVYYFMTYIRLYLDHNFEF